MTVKIRFVNMDASDALSAYTEKKLKSLSDKYDWLINCDVAFKLDNNRKEQGCICNMELSLSGPRIFATSNEKNFEVAVKETISDLEKQLKKRKEAFHSH